MSDEVRAGEKTFEMPMMPVYGIEIGRELGALDSRLTRVENDIQKLAAKIDVVDGRVDKCLIAINRMYERITALADGQKSDRTIMFGILVAVLAGLILQFLKLAA